MAKKKTGRSALPFPKEVFIQHALEVGEVSSPSDSFLMANDDEGCVTHDVRVGVYRLAEVVVIEKTETYKRVASK